MAGSRHGTYVITEVAEGTVMIMHLEDHPFGKTEEGQKLADGTTSQLGGLGARFICPKEAFLSVATVSYTHLTLPTKRIV